MKEKIPEKIPYTIPAKAPAFAPVPVFPMEKYISNVFKSCSILFITHVSNYPT